MRPDWVSLTPEVAGALQDRRPLVALESAVYSHGLPAHDARRLARRLDETVRAAGATPALVAVRDGRVIVGSEEAGIEFLLRADAKKVAGRDLAVAVGLGKSGGTTVSATLAVAHAAGIRVMTTGGIGGVHRDAEITGDVSADLAALAYYPLVVVCAGAKAFCDAQRTAEMLDSLGVTVVGYQTDVVPAFLARSTGVAVPHRVDRAEQIAAIAHAKAAMAGRSALLVVQPPPRAVALSERELDDAVSEGLARVRAAGARGADVTPFLLHALADITGGRSLTANLAVLEANAALAAATAMALARSPHVHPSQRESGASRGTSSA